MLRLLSEKVFVKWETSSLKPYDIYIPTGFLFWNRMETEVPAYSRIHFLDFSKKAPIEVPNLPVDMNSWGRSACSVMLS